MPPIDDLTGMGAAAPSRSPATLGVQTPEPDARPRTANRLARGRSKRTASRLPPAVAVALFLIAAAAITTAAYLGFKEAQTQVHAQDRFIVATRNIQVTPPPIWIRADLLAEVQRSAGLEDSLSTLDNDLASRLHAAFGMHPWVSEVTQVQVIHPATIRVELRYREPVIVAQTARSIEVLDRDGVLLPTTDLPDPRLYLTVTGIRSTPTGPVGTQWDDPAVLAAVSLAGALSPHHRALGLTTIDVSGYRTAPAHGPLYLLTEQGTRVKWGRAPDVDYPGEIPVQDKLDRLQRYLAEHGSLDAPAGPYDIDITHWQEISVRPRGDTRPRGR